MLKANTTLTTVKYARPTTNLPYLATSLATNMLFLLRAVHSLVGNKIGGYEEDNDFHDNDFHATPEGPAALAEALKKNSTLTELRYSQLLFSAVSSH